MGYVYWNLLSAFYYSALCKVWIRLKHKIWIVSISNLKRLLRLQCPLDDFFEKDSVLCKPFFLRSLGTLGMPHVNKWFRILIFFTQTFTAFVISSVILSSYFTGKYWMSLRIFKHLLSLKTKHTSILRRVHTFMQTISKQKSMIYLSASRLCEIVCQILSMNPKVQEKTTPHRSSLIFTEQILNNTLFTSKIEFTKIYKI